MLETPLSIRGISESFSDPSIFDWISADGVGISGLVSLSPLLFLLPIHHSFKFEP